MTTYAYARVSARDQNLQRQIAAFTDIVLQVLSFVAENERDNIKARQAEGIRAAINKGIKFGRPGRDYTDEFLNIADDYIHKRITSKAAMRVLGIKRENFYYHIRRIKRMI